MLRHRSIGRLARRLLAGVCRRSCRFPPCSNQSANARFRRSRSTPRNKSVQPRPGRHNARRARRARVPRQRNPAAAPVASDLGQGARADGSHRAAGATRHSADPGGVAIVPAEAYRNSTVANTIKDILDYVPAFSRSPNGATTRGSRSAAPACHATSICAASSSTWTGSRSTRPTATAISRRSIRPPTNMSRSTRAPTPCNSAPTRWAAPSIS